VIHGDAKSIPNLKFDTFIANINRNILVRDMKYYVEHIKDNGRIIFSGFYDGEDFEIIKAHAAKFNLKLAQYKLNNQWVAATFIY
jgi:ribosomal protein L11 methyltransferase